MNEPLGYSSSDGDVVTIRMTRGDYESLLLALGISAGAMARENQALSGWLALANRLNAGNPHWTPYEDPDVLLRHR